MKIVAIADTHGSRRAVQDCGDALSEADLVLLAGDLTNFGHRRDAADILQTVRQYNGRILGVSGNCDSPDVAEFLAQEGVSLHGRHEVREGVAFLGVGGSLPAPTHTPNEFSDEQLGSFLEQAADGLDVDLPWVLLAHQPPVETTADTVHGGEHVGSAAVRAFIEEHRPLACFTGHIHEGRGMDTIGPARIINPGPLKQGRYAFAELDGGLRTAEIRTFGPGGPRRTAEP